MTSSSLMFTVRRCQPELVPPAAPTPREVKLLSDIDDQEGMRFNSPVIFIYRHKPSMVEKDPLKVLRHALSRTLVYYYPLAGRIREGAGRKLMVDCTGEGVMFIEAEADVTLDQFGDALHPPFPCFQQLLYDVPGSTQIIDRPIRQIQVTRLKCGGFIVAMNWNHTLGDAAGLRQFMTAWAEMARGAHRPSIQPVWNREILMARDPPRITCNHLEYKQIFSPNTIKEEDTASLVHRSFFFRASDIAALRLLVPFHLRQCTTFDLIASCFWCCRTKALQLEADKEVRMMCVVNARSRFNINNSPLVGYYGNCFAYPAAVTTAGKLCGNPFGYAVELVRKLKAEVTEEYMHSVADLMVIKERCLFTTVRSCVISDLTRARLSEVNFGWGEGVYGGVAKGGAGTFPGSTYIVPYKNINGEETLMLPICLPSEDMKRFAKELDEMLGNQNYPTPSAHNFAMSTL
ncbi:benzyl alcohol O-benzoyltransferase [Medicago truncatula]|uniref:Benzyl alcohol O-benzoyltransferase n=2 Tax=Medicago truncatula TaxID=3880 RepID=G7L0T5_MEDTR|nr:benzyl alcohol O-benzoyltransferase [Medicago truncatula]AES82606.1 benzyl alcohol O-benzoyltransferase [Medicago truncatula]